MKKNELKARVICAQRELDTMSDILRTEHARLSSYKEITNHQATEKVAVASLLEMASRAQRELTKMQHTLDWFIDYTTSPDGE